MSFRRVKAGEPVRIPAPAYNAWCEAAEAFQASNQGFRSGSAPRPRRELGTVVLVKNTDTGQKNWSPFSPVVVTPPGGSPASSALDFAANPHFRGNQPTGASAEAPFDMMGVTQEPIAYDRMGRVAIAGITCALLTDEYEYGGQGHSYAKLTWDATHSRLTLQRTVWGHARFLLQLDDTPYQDGTYNDQYLSLIDLNPGPQKLWAQLNQDLKGTGQSAAAGIWVRGTSGWQDTGITLGVFPPPLLGEDETIDAGNWVMLEYVPLEWRWYVVGTTGEVVTECMP